MLLIVVTMNFNLGGASGAPPKLKFIAGLSNADDVLDWLFLFLKGAVSIPFRKRNNRFKTRSLSFYVNLYVRLVFRS